MFSGAFAEKVGTKAEKKRKKEREEKKGNDVSSFPPFGNSCYEAIFSYDLGKSNSNDVGIGLTRPFSSLFG